MPGIQKRLNHNVLTQVEERSPGLMKTIKFPKNLHFLTNQLPKPNYTPLKVKKVEKYQFLQTLAGYKDPSLIPSSSIEDGMKSKPSTKQKKR